LISLDCCQRTVGDGIVINGAHPHFGSSMAPRRAMSMADGIGDLTIGFEFSDLCCGDAESASYVVLGRTRDADHDGLIFSRDNCLLSPNRNQRDTNADGIGNACDADLNDDCIVDRTDLTG
jgi:hypothetical protein